MRPGESPFATANRAAKVKRLVAAIDSAWASRGKDPHFPGCAAEVAGELEGFTSKSWSELAKAAGVNQPSVFSIEQVISVYQRRASFRGELS